MYHLNVNIIKETINQLLIFKQTAMDMSLRATDEITRAQASGQIAAYQTAVDTLELVLQQQGGLNG